MASNGRSEDYTYSGFHTHQFKPPKTKILVTGTSGITLLVQHTAIFRDSIASLLTKLYSAEEKYE